MLIFLFTLVALPLHSFLEFRTVIIVIKRKEHALRNPYQMCTRARVISEIEEVQERMKADMEAMKEQMATMMEAMMSIKKILEVNAAAIVATSIIAEVDPTPPSGLNQINHPTSDMVGPRGKELGSTNDPHFVQVHNKHSFPPYGLPPNYTPPDVAHAPDENVNNSTPILIES